MTKIELRTRLSAYAKGVIPTKVSQLENDLEYIREAPISPESYVRKGGNWETLESELQANHYIKDVSADDGKVYGRQKGQWYWLDLENMGAINIITPIDSGLKSREIPKEESGSPRNAYEIELNKWEGNLEDLPQVLEEGKFYYAVDPEEVSELLNGGSASTNEFDQAVDILTTRFQLRTDTQFNWQVNNPILDFGEPGWEVDTGKLKIGDGETEWSELSYVYTILNNNVVENLSIRANEDNTSIVSQKVNLGTQNIITSSVTLPLADGTKSGLMTIANYNTLQDLVSRVSNLEGKTTRLLYENTIITNDITIIDNTELKVGSILKSGSVINGVEIAEDITLNEDTQLDNEDIIKTGSTVANSSIINDVNYPNAELINGFVEDEGYLIPFEGISVVVLGTNHIWHYYENNNIGWRDDGVGDLANFTNETAGIILGSEQQGKIFAESDGTGSVNGWNTLVNDVSDLNSNVTGILNSKVMTINNQSTNETYPGTKAVYDFVQAHPAIIMPLSEEEIDEMWNDEEAQEEIIENNEENIEETQNSNEQNNEEIEQNNEEENIENNEEN